MSEVIPSWWVQIQGEQLRQGDYLPDCFIPLFHPEFGKAPEITESIEVRVYDCIVLTQSCDLENQKAPLVALCPLFALTAYEKVDPASGPERRMGAGTARTNRRPALAGLAD